MSVTRTPFFIKKRQKDLLYETEAFGEMLPEITEEDTVWMVEAYGTAIRPRRTAVLVLADSKSEVEDLIDTTSHFLMHQDLGGFKTCREVKKEDMHTETLKEYVKDRLERSGPNRLIWRRDDGKPGVLGHGSDWIRIPQEQVRDSW